MTLRSAIDILALLVCSVYCTIPLFWLAMHPFMARWRSRRPPRLSLFDRAHLGRISSRLAFLLDVALPPCARFYANLGGVDTGAAIVCFWTGLLASTGAALQEAFDRTRRSPAWTELEPDRSIARYSSRPAFARACGIPSISDICARSSAGASARDWFALYGLAALFAIVTGALMIALEDRELEARFGELYRAYRRAVPAVIPRSIR
jgi:hypothetical protein